MMFGAKKKMHKPPNLLYGVDDRPSFWVLLVLGVEHVALLLSCLMASVFFAHELGASSSQTMSFINVALIAGGVSSILQVTRKWGLGSGYFCLHTSSYVYLPASLAAAHTGGLSLVFGMTIIAGFMQLLLSRVVGRLRVLFPPEVAGLVVAMVGLALAPHAVKSLVGLSDANMLVEGRNVLVGFGTLAILVGFNVWGKKGFKLYSILLGILFGYGSAYALGVLSLSRLNGVRDLAFFSLPHIEHPGFSFDLNFLLPFLIAGICASLKLTGDIITCQKINDLDWKIVDMESVKRGITAEGLGTMVAGVLGGTGLAASSSNIGMSYASGATSRYIGYITGIFFILLAFFPQSAYVLSCMPSPVIGAIAVYAACFMIVTGWSIIMTRMIDARKTFVVGISLVMGMSVLVVPEIYAPVPAQLKPVFGSAVALSAMTGVLLTSLFRIGIAKKAQLILGLTGEEGQKIHDFFVDMGGKWGARPGVIRKAAAASAEVFEYVLGVGQEGKDLSLRVFFEEDKVTVHVAYHGPEIVLSHDRPHPKDLLEDDQALARMSGFLISQYPDKITQKSGQGLCRVEMRFNH